MNIKQEPASVHNYSRGRSGKTVNKIIVHWIVGSLASADATFKNPNRNASAHYGIEDDTIHQYVNESDTAWHASKLTINRESIGIEHSGGELLSDKKTRRKPSDKTHETSGLLVRDICKRYNIPIDRAHILPHNKFSATQCPGTLDIDKIIAIAKGGDEDMDDLNACIKDRDTNWNAANILASRLGKPLDPSDKIESAKTVAKEVDRIAKALDFEKKPDKVSINTIVSSIAGVKGKVSELQNKLTEAEDKNKAQSDEISRVNERLTTVTTERDTAINLKNDLEGKYDDLGATNERLKTDLSDCRSGQPKRSLLDFIIHLFK